MSSSSPLEEEKPLKDLPGGYGLPYVGAFKDRLNFYWFQGEIEYFKSRMEKYKSSVYRVNFAPGPPGFPDPKGIVVLDQKSFSILLDYSKVSKRNTLVGSFMPDLAFTGGYRALPYLDTTEEKHGLYKELIFDIMRSKLQLFFPAMSSAFAETSAGWEASIRSSGRAEVMNSGGNMVIKYLLGTILERDPMAPGDGSMGDDPHSTFQAWAGVQFAGIAYTNLPHLTEELLMHSFRLPFFPVKKQYDAIVRYFRANGGAILDMAASRYGLEREETLHCLVFSLGINTRLGLLKMLPPLVYYLAEVGPAYQAKLADELRAAGVAAPSDVSADTLAALPRVRAFVLEALRMNPSIFFVFGRARSDLVIESHDARFSVRKGELIGSHLYFVLRDERVFEAPHRFDPERFLGERGEALLPFLVWSNGRGDCAPTANDKQCPGKRYAELLCMQFVVELLLKYESVEVTPDSKISTTELSVFFKALNRRSS